MQGRQRNQKRNLNTFYLAVLLLLCIIGAGFSINGYQSYNADYHEDMVLAQTGLQHMRSAQTLLESVSQKSPNPETVGKARDEFSAALTPFTQLNSNLHSLPGISTSIPVYGTRLAAAMHLAPLAMGIAEAGIAGCDVVSLFLVKLHDPLNTHERGLTTADITSLDQQFQRIKVALTQAVNEADQVSVSDLQFDFHFAKTFALFQHYVPTIRTWLDTIEKLLPLLPTFIGVSTPANYLLEILDTTELRPGGGFIGNYGIATLSGGRLTSARITDTDLLDVPFRNAGHTIPYPSAYAWYSQILVPRSWSLRDSNLDADFPTAARYAEQNYKLEGGKVTVQGVIAITPALIQQVLEITGPIEVPEYHETVNAQNLNERIHYHQLGPAGEGPDYTPSSDGHSSLRKRFTELLAEHLLTKVRSLPPSISFKFFPLLLNSLHTKDIQVYLNADGAEQLLQRYQLDSAIRSPQSDSLFVVDANVAADKANSFIVYTMKDSVTLDEQGNGIHTTQLTYSWTLPGTDYGNELYQDYLRVYVPPQSTLQRQSGWVAYLPSNAFGRRVWSGFFTLRHGQTRTIALTWTVPKTAQRDATGWHYRSLVQRQAGVLWTMQTQITLPSCATGISTSGGVVLKSKQSAMLTTSLNEDVNLGVNYTC